MKIILILTCIICIILLLSSLLSNYNNKFKNIIILFIVLLFIYYFVINRKKLLLYFTNIYLKNSNIIDLNKYNSFDEFLTKHLNSKRRNDIKNEFKFLDHIKIINKPLSLYHIKYLYNFLISKIPNIYERYFDFILSLLVISTFELDYLDYYDKNDKLLGWSSYFINDGIYYDFLSSPNNIYISHICLNSIMYCFKHNIKKVDIGPTHDDIKKRKFNCDQYKINIKFMSLFT